MSDEKTSDDAKSADKALRKLEALRGPLDPADRYDAQIDAVKFAQDLIELGDRKARFALVIMSVLNAIAVLIAVRGGASLVPTSGPWAAVIALELAAYAVTTGYYIWQAISALRPRGVEPPRASDLPSQIAPGVSMRVLFHADVVARDRASYRALWDNLRQDNLNTELADQLHTLAGINQDKFAALDRLYFGLGVMTGLLATVLATLAGYHLLT
jgi:hypothetical protein